MFDLDGTLILSDRSLRNYRVLPGARQTLSALKARQVPFAVFTNGTAYPPAEQAAKLRKLGLPIDDEQMLTPSTVAAHHMRARGFCRALVLGSSGVGHALREAGIETFTSAQTGATQAQCVFVGWHPDCGMKDIEAACEAIWGGAQLYVASDVPFFATRQGRTIGYSFAITAAIRRLTQAPMILTGKPSVHALRFVARRLCVPMRSLVVVGDDPVVEILMAHRGGATALAVTTGTTPREQWARQVASRRPHSVLGDLREVLRWIPGSSVGKRGAIPKRRAAPRVNLRLE